MASLGIYELGFSATKGLLVWLLDFRRLPLGDARTTEVLPRIPPQVAVAIPADGITGMIWGTHPFTVMKEVLRGSLAQVLIDHNRFICESHKKPSSTRCALTKLEKSPKVQRCYRQGRVTSCSKMLASFFFKSTLTLVYRQCVMSRHLKSAAQVFY